MQTKTIEQDTETFQSNFKIAHFLHCLLTCVVFFNENERDLIDQIYDSLHRIFHVETEAVKAVKGQIYSVRKGDKNNQRDQLCLLLRQWFIAFLNTERVAVFLRDKYNFDVQYRFFKDYQTEIDEERNPYYHKINLN